MRCLTRNKRHVDLSIQQLDFNQLFQLPIREMETFFRLKTANRLKLFEHVIKCSFAIIFETRLL